MLASFDVSSTSGSYKVTTRLGLWGDTLGQLAGHIVIADEYFASQASAGGADVISLAAVESTKNLDRVPAIIEQLRRFGLSRDAKLLAIGGGIIQDITGFVASIYMRGVAWSYFPTTLLGMADSCIGGKSSINVGPYKNIVGTFHPPREIQIDPSLTDTLSAEQKVAGLCEAAKICFCGGAESFSKFCALRPTVHSDRNVLAQTIQISLATKARFIETDEFDRGERLLLNFGHTFGHAIESASHFRIGHGVAVGLGIIAALNLSNRLGYLWLPDGRTETLKNLLEDLLSHVEGMSGLLGNISLPDLMDAFGSDKKHNQQQFAVIIVSDDRVERLLLARSTANSAMIEYAFSNLLQQFAVH
ncbi:MAG TPA: 3-dehydroquinate synthase family protein [Rhizomicrobium sp.]